MRSVFVGCSDIAIETAKILIERKHEVIIIDTSKERLEELSEGLDCSFLCGDGSKPDVLRETDPKRCDLLFCLTGDDQDNIIAGLVGRSLGFKRVVTQINDSEYDTICRELGLEDVIEPSLTIGRYLADLASGRSIAELSSALKDEARFFMFSASKSDAGSIDDLSLPSLTRIVCYYRNGEFRIPKPDDQLRADDEVLLVTHSKHLEELRERWSVVKQNSKRDGEVRDETADEGSD